MEIIAFCGIDGSGKTTQISELKKNLELNGFKVYVAKVPYYPFHKFIGDEITQYDVRINMGFTFAEYYFKLLPKLRCEGYDYVLCDRHYLCHLAFAMTYGLSDIQLKKLLNIFSLAGKPTYTLYFEIPLQTALNRIKSRADKPIDSDETPDILGSTLTNYRELLSWLIFEDVIKIDATQNINDIGEKIIGIIRGNSE